MASFREFDEKLKANADLRKEFVSIFQRGDIGKSKIIVE